MGATMLVAAFAPALPLELVALVLVGFAGVMFLSMGNSTLQLASDPSMRGRVMSLWAVAFLGSTPIGGPAVGWIASELGGRAGLATGALACLVAAGLALLLGRRQLATPASETSSAHSGSGQNGPGTLDELGSLAAALGAPLPLSEA
jgi:MFS family permease